MFMDTLNQSTRVQLLDAFLNGDLSDADAGAVKLTHRSATSVARQSRSSGGLTVRCVLTK